MLENQKIKEGYQLAARYCSSAEKCISDVHKKLRQWGIDESLFESIIDLLKVEKFIDEQRYADAFVKDKFRFNKWGRIKIRYQLKAKGIEDRVVQKSISSQIDPIEYEEELMALLAAKMKKVSGADEYTRKAKVVNAMVAKGYESGLAFELYDNLE